MAADSSHQESFTELNELSRAVSRQIDEFSIDDGHADGFDQGFTVTYKAEKASLEKQLHVIEKEIANLEYEIEHQQATESIDDEDVDKLRAMLGDGSALDAGQRKVVDELSKQLELLSEVTGITFTSCKCTSTKFDTHQTERKYIVDGHSYDLNFQLEYDVTERQVAENIRNFYISALQIAVDEVTVHELETLIYRCEEANAVNLFLRSFSNFAKWFGQRHKTFLHFKNKYPDIVQLTEGEYGSLMQISGSDNGGAMWTTSWNLLITMTGDVTPEVDLFVKAPIEMVDMDDKAVLRQAPEKFRSMLQYLGIEQAVDAIIKIASI